MRAISALIIFSLFGLAASQALAKSPAERARFKQSTNFEQHSSHAPSSLGVATYHSEHDGDSVIMQPEEHNNCNSSWFRPLASTLGSVAGVFIGQSVGDGTGQQVGRILGGAATGVATNEAIKEMCK